MKLNCNVIRDLLPLYTDDICSGESRALVDEHLADCRECTLLLERLRSPEIEADLRSETEIVLSNQAKFFKRKSAVAGAIIAGIFMIPVLVCLIVNLAVGAALDWFFIVLASLITAASLIVVPLLAPEDKAFWTLVSFTSSLVFLLGVICIYTHGRWFFVAATPVLFGFSVCFLPFAVHAKPMKRLLGDKKGLTVMTTITVLYTLMMVSIGWYTHSRSFAVHAQAISLPIMAFIWVIFLLIRYLRCSGLTVGGMCAVIFGAFVFIADNLIMAWLGQKLALPVFRPFVWNYYSANDNIKWLILIGCALVGGILVGIGQRRKDK